MLGDCLMALLHGDLDGDIDALIDARAAARRLGEFVNVMVDAHTKKG